MKAAGFIFGVLAIFNLWVIGQQLDRINRQLIGIRAQEIIANCARLAAQGTDCKPLLKTFEE